MKKTFFAFILIASQCAIGVIVSAQTRDTLDGFLGIKWGETIEDSKVILRERGFAIQNADDEAIAAKGRFGGEDASILLLFYGNMFYCGSAELEQKNVRIDYQEYFSILSELYGPPFVTSDGSDSPLQLAEWKLQNSCSISLVFAKTLTITYTNDDLYHERAEYARRLKMGDL